MPEIIRVNEDGDNEGIAVPTEEEFLRFRKAVIKKLKEINGVLGEIWEKIAEVDGRAIENVDEAIDRAQRAERAVRRVKKAFESHEHEDE